MEFPTSILTVTTLAMAAGIVPARIAGTTVLTYDITGTPTVPQNYGDNVTGPVQGNHAYAGTGGYTPDIPVDYAYAPQNAPMTLWGTGYGNLTVVGWGPASAGRLTYTFTAAHGYLVTLLGFDLGCLLSSPQVVTAVTVRSGGAIRRALQDVPVPPGFGGHADVDFVPPPVAPVLVLEIDVPPGSALLYNPGLDNVAFGQTTNGIGGGMYNSPIASLQINGFGPMGLQGPFQLAIPASGHVTLDWTGPPGMPLVLATANLNPGVADPGCTGILDIGTPPASADLFVLFHGGIPTFPNALFRLTPAGTAYQAFSVPAFSGGVATLRGAVIQPPGSPCGIVLTAAFQLSFL